MTETRRLLQVLARGAQGTDRKVYLVTSAGMGEGKSTASALIALVAAQLFRKRVVVIDGDSRRPTLHQLLDIPQRPGLTDLMQHRESVDAVIQKTSHPSLFAISSGSPATRMSETYDDEAFGRLVQRVRTDFDMVIIDSAPIVPVVEPLLMAEHVDAILIVAMAGRTPINIIRRMRQIIGPLSSRIAGVVLNNAAEGLPYYYDYRYYGYEPTTHRRIRVRGHASDTDRAER